MNDTLHTAFPNNNGLVETTWLLHSTGAALTSHQAILHSFRHQGVKHSFIGDRRPSWASNHHTRQLSRAAYLHTPGLTAYARKVAVQRRAIFILRMKHANHIACPPGLWPLIKAHVWAGITSPRELTSPTGPAPQGFQKVGHGVSKGAPGSSRDGNRQ